MYNKRVEGKGEEDVVILFVASLTFLLFNSHHQSVYIRLRTERDTTGSKYRYVETERRTELDLQLCNVTDDST